MIRSRMVVLSLLLLLLGQVACSSAEEWGTWRGIYLSVFEGGGFRACGSAEYWMVLGDFRVPSDAWARDSVNHTAATAVVVQGRVRKAGDDGLTASVTYEHAVRVEQVLRATADTAGWCS